MRVKKASALHFMKETSTSFPNPKRLATASSLYSRASGKRKTGRTRTVDDHVCRTVRLAFQAHPKEGGGKGKRNSVRTARSVNIITVASDDVGGERRLRCLPSLCPHANSSTDAESERKKGGRGRVSVESRPPTGLRAVRSRPFVKRGEGGREKKRTTSQRIPAIVRAQ